MQERCRLISESQWREYLELVTKCHRLEKQLDVATKALNLYADKGNWCNCLSWDGFMEDNEVVCDGQFGENGFEPAQKALKEIDLVGTSTKESK